MILPFFAIHWEWSEEEEDDDDGLQLRVYGRTENDESVLIRIVDYCPHFYIELPYTVSWNKMRVKHLVQALEDQLDRNYKSKAQFGDCDDAESMVQKTMPVRRGLVYKKKLYTPPVAFNAQHQAVERTYPFLYVTFRKMSHARRMNMILRRPLVVTSVGKILCSLHEQNIEPILKYTAHMKLPLCGWIQAGGEPARTERISRCTHEIMCSWNNLMAFESDRLVHPTLLSLDVEAYPSRLPAMPNPDYDPAYCVCIIICRQGEPEDKWERHAHVIGKAYVPKNIVLHSYRTEAALLVGCAMMIREADPDIIMGYNILGFDNNYLIRRAEKTESWLGFRDQGRLRHVYATIKEEGWSSSAFGAQNFRGLEIPGRFTVDMMTIIRREHSFSSYKLNDVAQAFVGETKDPITPEHIYQAYATKDPRLMGRIAKYCVQDAMLTLKLFNHLQTWFSLCEMARVMRVPIPYLYLKGQQIKMFSQYYYRALHHNFVIPYRGYSKEKEEEQEKFAGAVVFHPTPGLYHNVLVFDFSSLYPSIIISTNIDHTTLVPETWQDIPPEHVTTIAWETHSGCEHDPRFWIYCPTCHEDIFVERASRCPECNTKIREKALPKIKVISCGKQSFSFLREPEGILPALLKNLLSTRAATKGQIKEVSAQLSQATDEEEKARLKTQLIVLDKRQLGYKISANSMYGAMGAKKGYLPLLPGAMSTTARGRELISQAKRVIEDRFGGSVVYGDSVPGDEPILVRYPNGHVDIRAIEDLASNWSSYPQFKSDERDRTEKKQASVDLEVWANGAWCKIKRVIQHRVKKDIYRINTHTGCVDVTQDHSLLTPKLECVKPTEVSEGDRLLHSFPDTFAEFEVPCSRASPNAISMGVLNGSQEIKKKFIEEHYGEKTTIICDSKVRAQGMYYLLRSLGYPHVGVSCFEDNYHISINACSDSWAVKRIAILIRRKDSLVYDLETESGIFHAGVGAINVKNTDSCFISFRKFAHKAPSAKLAQACAEEGRVVSAKINKIFPPPVKMEFENLYQVLLLLTPKRYAALLPDGTLIKKGIALKRRDNPPCLKTLYQKVLLRIMDGAPGEEIEGILCDSIYRIANGSLPLSDYIISKSLRAVYKADRCEPCKQDTINGVCPQCDKKYVLPAHVYLARRMRERGQIVEAGDRLDFIYINRPYRTQRELLEDPDYYRKRSFALKLFYLYYIKHQICKPIKQLTVIAYGRDMVTPIYLAHKVYAAVRAQYLHTIQRKIVLE